MGLKVEKAKMECPIRLPCVALHVGNAQEECQD